MPGWKFLTNHALVLCLVAQQHRFPWGFGPSRPGDKEFTALDPLHRFQFADQRAKARELLQRNPNPLRILNKGKGGVGFKDDGPGSGKMGNTDLSK